MNQLVKISYENCAKGTTSAYSCPAALALKDLEVKDPSVTAAFVRGNGHAIETPPILRDFIREYDAGNKPGPIAFILPASFFEQKKSPREEILFPSARSIDFFTTATQFREVSHTLSTVLRWDGLVPAIAEKYPGSTKPITRDDLDRACTVLNRISEVLKSE